MIGGVIQSSYLITRRLELSLRYAVVHVMSQILSRAQERAQLLISQATEEQEQQHLQAQYGAVGRLQREQEATVGLNLYLRGQSLKLSSDLSLLHRNQVDRDRMDLRFRCQMQLAF